MENARFVSEKIVGSCDREILQQTKKWKGNRENSLREINSISRNYPPSICHFTERKQNKLSKKTARNGNCLSYSCWKRKEGIILNYANAEKLKINIVS